MDRWQFRLQAALSKADEIDEIQTGASVNSIGAEDLGTVARDEQHRSERAVRKAPDGMAERKTESPLVYKSVLKRGVMAILIRKPTASDMEICHELDLDGAPLPKTWEIADIQFFESAYRNSVLRPRIQAAISKIRADLRRNQIIP